MNLRGCWKKPGPKPRKQPGFSQAARHLAGAEILVAIVGPSPPRGGKGKTLEQLRKPCVTRPDQNRLINFGRLESGRDCAGIAPCLKICEKYEQS
jgi:hypothetical protein